MPQPGAVVTSVALAQFGGIAWCDRLMVAGESATAHFENPAWTC
jgi:hypothetical protein